MRSAATFALHFAGSSGSGSTNHNAFATNLSSGVGLLIEGKNTAYNVGIGNFMFDNGVEAIPKSSI